MANMKERKPPTIQITLPGLAQEPPVEGATAVWWMIDGLWTHTGWLMPTVEPCGGGYKYGTA